MDIPAGAVLCCRDPEERSAAMRRALLMAGAVAAALLATTAPASAAPAADTTPPALSVVRHGQFALGSQVTNEDLAGTASARDDYTVTQQLLQWSATDASGICGYDLYQVLSGFEPHLVLQGTTDTAYVAELSDYDGTFGGGSFVVLGYRVVAHDCAGNTTTRDLGAQPVVVQENGANHKRPNSTLSGLSVTCAGAWNVLNGPQYSRGAARATTAVGASATLHANSATAFQVAVVTRQTTSPLEYVADVYVDGTKVSTIDNSGRTTQERTVVFNRLLSKGTHTVRIVRTDGAPLVLDAFLLG